MKIHALDTHTQQRRMTQLRVDFAAPNGALAGLLGAQLKGARGRVIPRVPCVVGRPLAAPAQTRRPAARRVIVCVCVWMCVCVCVCVCVCPS
jgi:hypothetical protein